MERNDKKKIKKCSWKLKCKRDVYIWVNTKEHLIFSPLCKWHYFLAQIRLLIENRHFYKRIEEVNRKEYLKREEQKYYGKKFSLKNLKEKDVTDIDYCDFDIDEKYINDFPIRKPYTKEEWEKKRKRIQRNWR